MLLAIDVGNTNTVLGVFEEKALIRSWRVKTDPRDTSDELWIRYSALVEGFEITALAICSTVPATLRELRTLPGLLQTELLALDHPRIPRGQSFLLQDGLPLRIDFHQRLRDGPYLCWRGKGTLLFEQP